jgi:hypothetical protein
MQIKINTIYENNIAINVYQHYLIQKFLFILITIYLHS